MEIKLAKNEIILLVLVELDEWLSLIMKGKLQSIKI